MKGAGTHLYCAAYLGENTAYPNRQTHLKEVTAYAAALDFFGPIELFDLSGPVGNSKSAFVEFKVNAGRCDVYASPWVNPGPAKETFDIKRKDDHKTGPYMQAGFGQPSKMLVE